MSSIQTPEERSATVKAIEDAFKPVPEDERVYDPASNHDAISIIRQLDGNWMGWMHKHGRLVEVRDISPGMVLERLITHS